MAEPPHLHSTTTSDGLPSFRGGGVNSCPSGVTIRTGPSMRSGPLGLGVMVTWVMRPNIGARFPGRRGISRVRRTLHTGLSLIVCGAALAACLGERGPFTNRMAHSGTSYLARAAGQPVRWQPWGRDAVALAAKLDRPVLLDLGSDARRLCGGFGRAIYS